MTVRRLMGLAAAVTSFLAGCECSVVGWRVASVGHHVGVAWTEEWRSRLGDVGGPRQDLRGAANEAVADWEDLYLGFPYVVRPGRPFYFNSIKMTDH